MTENKVALVTGGTRGIGRAISLRLASQGYNVVVCYLRNRAAASETIGELEGRGVKAQAIRADVGDEDELDDLFAQITDTYGRLDVLVSNAATGVIKPFPDLRDRAWDWTMNANARALFLAARRCVPLMQDGGNIIALSSQGSAQVLPGYAVVGASKAAIESLIRYLAVELGPHIRANVISPGVVDTGALDHFPMRSEMLAAAMQKTPGGRLATPEDVADVVELLLDDRSKMITGQTVVVDGGARLLA